MFLLDYEFLVVQSDENSLVAIKYDINNNEVEKHELVLDEEESIFMMKYLPQTCKTKLLPDKFIPYSYLYYF